MTTTETVKHLERAACLRAQAQGLIRLAEMIEATPDLDACYIKPGKPLELNAWYATSPADLAAIARAGLANGATVEKSAESDIYALQISWGDVTALALAQRGEVCERVVTGTETVTRTVPDPTAPLVEVTETVEHVEWVCRPLLADQSGKDTPK